MGLKGNLSTVSLANVFQTLSKSSSSGLLRVQAPEGPRFVEIQNGAISIAGRSAGRIMLGDLLMARGLIDDAGLAEALQLQKKSGKMLGQVLIESGLLSMAQLEEALRFQIEEEVCELFTLHKGDFDFLEGAGLDARIAPAGGMVRLNLNLADLLIEAARRAEEWKAIEQRVASQSFLFQLGAEGIKAVQSSDGLSPEGMILLRLVQQRRTIEAIVQKACLGRFNTNRMLMELWDAGFVEPTPLQDYIAAAREHLRLGRLEEAQRVAEEVVARGEAAPKQDAQALLAEISKARKPGSTTPSAALNVSADPKVRSEVIRRAPANLILKKQRSSWPLVVVGGLVLACLGGGAYYYFSFAAGGGSEYTMSRKQLEEAASKAQELIASGKYAEGLQLLRDFRTLNSDVRKLATELFERRQKDVEAALMQSIERFDDANKRGSAEGKKAAADELKALIDIGVLTPFVETKRARARVDLDAYLDGQRTAQFEQKFNEIENGPDKSGDARLKACLGMLVDNPPEAVAVKVRAEVSRLERARRDAARLLKQARASRDAGDLDAAKLAYERVKQVFAASAVAAEAGKELDAAAAALTAMQSDQEKIDALLAQNKAADARAALIKFLEGKPTHQLAVRAIMQLQSMQPPDEAELVAGLKAAAALYDKQPPDAAAARKAIAELVEKYPYAKASRAATLKVAVDSQPPGAAVAVNGKAAGVTPLTLDIPALGVVRIAFTKEGCRPEDIVARDLRAERLMATLDRTPDSSCRMPVPAKFGMGTEMEQLVIGGPTTASGGASELVLCSRQDLRVTRRIKLPASAPSATADNEVKPPSTTPPMGISNGEAFVPLPESALLGVKLAHGEIRRIDLSGPASSSPYFFETSDRKPCFGLATQAGYDCCLVEDGKSLKRAPMPGAEKPAPQGAAFDGEFFFIPRCDFAVHSVNAQTAAQKWAGSLDSELCGPPALYPVVLPGAARQGESVVAVAAFDGRVAAFDALSGTNMWRRNSGVAVTVGPVSAGKGFLLVRRDGTAEMLPLDKKGEPAWTIALAGEPVLPPLVIRDRNKPQGKLVAVCIKALSAANAGQDSGGSAVVALAPDTGAVLWRASLPATAVALGTDGEHLFISTEDAELTVFDLK
jgi:hypothetical protein